MKRQHSYRVEGIGESLVNMLDWPHERAVLGVAACLLHDTGRFSQFREFRTLGDALSVDHGERGVRELKRHFPREICGGDEWDILLTSVGWHNKKELPQDLSPAVLPVCRLVRDADKSDVFYLVQQHIDEGRVQDLLPRYRADAPLTGAVLDEIDANGKASYKNVASLADFLLLQITWLLDVNYAETLRLVEQGGYVEKLIARLPLTPRAQSVLDGLLERIQAHKVQLAQAN
jgi:hypothetical protein